MTSAETALVGKKDISRYAKRSWQTVKGWIERRKFPAKKIDGIWESDKILVDEWKREQISPPCQE